MEMTAQKAPHQAQLEPLGEHLRLGPIDHELPRGPGELHVRQVMAQVQTRTTKPRESLNRLAAADDMHHFSAGPFRQRLTLLPNHLRDDAREQQEAPGAA